MLSNICEEDRRVDSRGGLNVALAALAALGAILALLAPQGAAAQQQQQQQQAQRPVVPPATPQRAPANVRPAPVNGVNNGLNNNALGVTNPFLAPGRGAANVAPAVQQQQRPTNNNFLQNNRQGTQNNGAPTHAVPQNGARAPTTVTRQSLANQPKGPPVRSQTFAGHPGPAGSIETKNRNGDIVRKAADGSVIDVRSPKNGMLIHHSLDGNRKVIVERPDRSRIVASSRGIQYVQHPYNYGGHSYDHRTLYVQGHLFHQLYRPYNYGGTNLDVYATSRYYDPKFYQWATTPMKAPEPFTWGYTTSSPPWFTYYKSYFKPEPTYSSPLLWLTDFLFASSLSTHYATAQPSSDAQPSDASPVTPQVKQMVADEIGRQVKQESTEAQENAQNKEPEAGASSVVTEISDRQTHVFVVDSDVDLVDPSGRRCMISLGDVVQVVGGPQSSTGTVSAIVLASKGGVECERAAQVDIALNDLQEMQNHMRETVDQGMANTKAGKSSASVTPAFATSVPPPDPDAARELDQQQQLAAATDG
jgi:hypothetical protein